VAFKEKEPHKAKSTQDWNEENKVQKSFDSKGDVRQRTSFVFTMFSDQNWNSKTRMEPTDLSKLVGSTKVNSLVKTLGD
jgi:hypothetical protein